MHVSTIEAVRHRAAGDWGHESASISAAAHDLKDIPAAAALEFVRRLNQVCDALAQDKSKPIPPEMVPRHKKARQFPGVKLGSILYTCDDLEDGILAYVVIYVEDDYALMIASKNSNQPRWVVSSLFNAPSPPPSPSPSPRELEF